MGASGVHQAGSKPIGAAIHRAWNALKRARIPDRELLYILLMGAALALGFIRTIVFAARLSPAGMGLLAIASTVASYGVFLQFGLLSGLNRELPVRLGGNQLAHASALVGNATNAFAVIMIAGLTILYLATAQVPFSDVTTKDALLVGGVLAFASPFGQIVVLRLRAEQRILSFSSLQLVNALVILLFGVFAIRYLGYKGPIVVTALTYLIGFIVIGRTLLRPVDYTSFSLKQIAYLVKIGLPLMGAGVLTSAALTMDRFFLIKYASATEVGIYHIGALALTFGIMLESVVNQYVSPKLLFRYGQGESLRFVFDEALKVSLVVVFFMVLALPLVPGLARLLLAYFLPAYGASAPLVPVFYVGAIFICLRVHVPIPAANRPMLDFYASLCVFVVTLVGYATLARYQAGMVSYAYVNVGGQMLSAVLITGISWWLVKQDSRSLGAVSR